MTDKLDTESKYKYLKHLPAIFQDTTKGEESSFFERYLDIFETILTGVKESALKDNTSIGEMVDVIGNLFYPGFSFLYDKDEKRFLPPVGEEQKKLFNRFFNPEIEEFLTWLASWMSLVLKEDWDVEKKRVVIAKIIPIYKIRGTKDGLEKYLNTYVDGGVRIYDELMPLQIGVNSTVGVNTIIDGLPTYSFIVDIILATPEPKTMLRKLKILEKIIEIEKPVHTSYKINVKVPTMQIGVHSKVEVDTLLW